MDATVKVTIKKVINLNSALTDYFEGDIKETLKTLFLKQGIHYKDIEFEFDYEDNEEGDYN